jgi:hypothetical protein
MGRKPLEKACIQQQNLEQILTGKTYDMYLLELRDRVFDLALLFLKLISNLEGVDDQRDELYSEIKVQ